jgi:hypothetical protein
MSFAPPSAATGPARSVRSSEAGGARTQESRETCTTASWAAKTKAVMC